MLSYETIDALCDAINPLLFVLCLTGIGLAIRRKETQAAIQNSLFLFIALLLVYSLMAIDHTYTIWPAFDSDYSTHTAFLLAMCASLSRQFRRTGLWIIIALVYMCLMYYQKYHTLLDMLSTSLVITVLLLALHYVLSRTAHLKT